MQCLRRLGRDNVLLFTCENCTNPSEDRLCIANQTHDCQRRAERRGTGGHECLLLHMEERGGGGGGGAEPVPLMKRGLELIATRKKRRKRETDNEREREVERDWSLLFS